MDDTRFPPSLVKYEAPQLYWTEQESIPTEDEIPEERGLSVDGVPICHLLALEEKKTKEVLRKFLNEAIPPRTYQDEDEKLWIQYVSKEPETAEMDAVDLQNNLDVLTAQRHARETGVCPIRRELYDQCFDELVRRVMIDDLDQGHLLAKVRDELRKTLGVYEDLYRIGEAFGIRKALQTKQLKTEKDAKVQQAQKEKEVLSEKLEKLTVRLETVERKAIEERPIYKKKHAEELRYAKKLNQQLKEQLEKCTEQNDQIGRSPSE